MYLRTVRETRTRDGFMGLSLSGKVEAAPCFVVYELSIFILGDTRKREDSPLFLKSLIECQSMHQEIAERNGTGSGWGLSNLATGRVPPLENTPATWAPPLRNVTSLTFCAYTVKLIFIFGPIGICLNRPGNCIYRVDNA